MIANTQRLGHNSTMYEESITPQHWPGGGCFALLQLSLDSLYDLHSKCRNWWTQSNRDLPLCRYLGCYLKMYQCENLDYIVRVTNNVPSPSNKLTYPSMHPYMMLMSSHKKIIPSKKNRKRRKPYYKMFIPPPQQLETKWYFQVDFTKHPLLQIHAAATDLNNVFIKPTQNSTTVTFNSLNTTLIQNRNMSTTAANDYWYFKQDGTLKKYFYLYDGQITSNTETFNLYYLTPLTNIKRNTPGQSFHHYQPGGNITQFKEYTKDWYKYAGNPFHHEIDIDHIFMSYKSPQAIIGKLATINKENPTWKDIMEQGTGTDFTLTPLLEPLFVPFQYNPYKDTGQDTVCYLLSNSNGNGWDPSSNDNIRLDGFPLWLILWGFQDFQTKLKEALNINENYIICIRTHFTQRPTDMLIVPISTSFIQGNSPYENQCLPSDINRWYPMVQYQEEEINKILATGPATPFLNDELAENINIFYSFRFKWGGCPPKTVNVDNPAHQAQYPIPRNEHETTSLQNPAHPPETLLYSFDHRHGQYTKTALDRITKDWTTESFVSSITDPDLRRDLQQTFSQLETAEEEEHQKETQVQLQLQQLKHQQQRLRQRIILLMSKLK